MVIPMLSWSGDKLQRFQFGSPSLTFVVEQKECFPCIRRGYFRHDRMIQGRFRIL